MFQEALDLNFLRSYFADLDFPLRKPVRGERMKFQSGFDDHWASWELFTIFGDVLDKVECFATDSRTRIGSSSILASCTTLLTDFK